MKICGQCYDILREDCMNCEDYIKCDNNYCYTRMLFTDDKKEISFLNERIAINLGG